MTRENYFKLLDLSVDPPEMDQNIIVEALQRKRAEWTESLKHPAKSVEAKKYIDLIPEIRKVMFDPDLRQKEVKDAGGPRRRKDETTRRQVEDTIGNNDKKIVGKSNPSEKSFEKITQITKRLNRRLIEGGEPIRKHDSMLEFEKEMIRQSQLSL